MDDDHMLSSQKLIELDPGKTLIYENQTSRSLRIRVTGQHGTSVETVLLIGSEMRITAGSEDLTVETFDLPDTPTSGQLQAVPTAGSNESA